MSHFDDLPRRDATHELEEAAVVAFQAKLAESGCFILQGTDRKDYGTDCQIEVIADGRATNIRVYVQLKGTERALNADRSLSVEVRRTNLNYLLMQPYSIYVCYHPPSGSLLSRPVASVLRQYEHGSKPWTEQESLTVSFNEELTLERLQQLAALARAEATSSRDRRIEQTNATLEDLPRQILTSALDVHVPENIAQARYLLRMLYEKDADEAISGAFDKFVAVIGANSDEVGGCYMAEINLGMDGMSRHPRRIEDAISFFRARLDGSRYQLATVHYTIGNAFHALRDEQEAKQAFEAALEDPALGRLPGLAAQIHKNLGSSYELLGEC